VQKGISFRVSVTNHFAEYNLLIQFLIHFNIQCHLTAALALEDPGSKYRQRSIDAYSYLSVSLSHMLRETTWECRHVEYGRSSASRHVRDSMTFRRNIQPPSSLSESKPAQVGGKGRFSQRELDVWLRLSGLCRIERRDFSSVSATFSGGIFSFIQSGALIKCGG
jgi:hypothetical protein